MMNLDFLLKLDLNAYAVSNVEFFQDNDNDCVLHILCSDSESNKNQYSSKKTMIYFISSQKEHNSRQSFGDHDVHVSIGIHNHP